MRRVRSAPSFGPKRWKSLAHNVGARRSRAGRVRVVCDERPGPHRSGRYSPRARPPQSSASMSSGRFDGGAGAVSNEMPVNDFGELPL